MFGLIKSIFDIYGKICEMLKKKLKMLKFKTILFGKYVNKTMSAITNFPKFD